jgi:hypothetical protein
MGDKGVQISILARPRAVARRTAAEFPLSGQVYLDIH